MEMMIRLEVVEEAGKHVVVMSDDTGRKDKHTFDTNEEAQAAVRRALQHIFRLQQEGLITVADTTVEGIAKASA